MATIIAGGGGSEAEFMLGMKDAGFENIKRGLFIGLAFPFGEPCQKIEIDEIREGLDTLYGAEFDILTKEDCMDPVSVRRKIEKADFIYVSGGSTLNLMMRMKKFQVIEPLMDAYYQTEKYLTGASAGGICWCKFGAADSRHYASDPSKRVRVSGLGLINVLYAPHIADDNGRMNEAKRMTEKMKNIPVLGMDRAAIAVKDGKYRTFSCGSNGRGVKGCWKNGSFVTEDILTEEYRDLSIIEKV